MSRERRPSYRSGTVASADAPRDHRCGDARAQVAEVAARLRWLFEALLTGGALEPREASVGEDSDRGRPRPPGLAPARAAHGPARLPPRNCASETGVPSRSSLARRCAPAGLRTSAHLFCVSLARRRVCVSRFSVSHEHQLGPLELGECTLRRCASVSRRGAARRTQGSWLAALTSCVPTFNTCIGRRGLGEAVVVPAVHSTALGAAWRRGIAAAPTHRTHNHIRRGVRLGAAGLRQGVRDPLKIVSPRRAAGVFFALGSQHRWRLADVVRSPCSDSSLVAIGSSARTREPRARTSRSRGIESSSRGLREASRRIPLHRRLQFAELGVARGSPRHTGAPSAALPLCCARLE